MYGAFQIFTVMLSFFRKDHIHSYFFYFVSRHFIFGWARLVLRWHINFANALNWTIAIQSCWLRDRFSVSQTTENGTNDFYFVSFQTFKLHSIYTADKREHTVQMHKYRIKIYTVYCRPKQNERKPLRKRANTKRASWKIVQKKA